MKKLASPIAIVCIRPYLSILINGAKTPVRIGTIAIEKFKKRKLNNEKYQ
jgi:hypothetical protein